jgi:hypothetical protein
MFERLTHPFTWIESALKGQPTFLLISASLLAYCVMRVSVGTLLDVLLKLSFASPAFACFAKFALLCFALLCYAALSRPTRQ